MRRLLWCAFQLGIIIPVTLFSDTYAASEGRATTARDVALCLFLGVCLAALATGILSKLAGLTARLIGQKGAGHDGGLIVPTRGEFLNAPDAIRPRQKQLG